MMVSKNVDCLVESLEDKIIEWLLELFKQSITAYNWLSA